MRECFKRQILFIIIKTGRLLSDKLREREDCANWISLKLYQKFNLEKMLLVPMMRTLKIKEAC